MNRFIRNLALTLLLIAAADQLLWRAIQAATEIPIEVPDSFDGDYVLPVEADPVPDDVEDNNA